MIDTFGSIIDEVLTQMGLTQSSVDSNILTSVKLRINQIQDLIVFDRNWEWRLRQFYISTRPKYETGTISVTQGDATITGSGTSWSDIVKTGYLIHNGRIFKVDPYSSVSTTSLEIAAKYPEATASAQTYKIVYPNYILDPSISSIVNVYIEGKELVLKNLDRMTLAKESVGTPTEACIGGGLEADFYTTGTVSMTNGSKTVTGSGTTFTADMEGMPFIVNEFPVPYVVQSVASSTSLTLREAYQGSTGSGKSYKIAPKNSLIMQLRDTPDDYYFVEIDALIKAPKLIDGNDISIIPNHAPLLHGSIWLALHDLEDKNPVRIQQARADFERTLKQLRDSHKAITDVRWQSQGEYNVRKSGLNGFDPLSRR